MQVPALEILFQSTKIQQVLRKVHQKTGLFEEESETQDNKVCHKELYFKKLRQ